MLVIRRQLRTKSDLGEYGPEAIHRERQQRGERVIPAVANHFHLATHDYDTPTKRFQE